MVMDMWTPKQRCRGFWMPFHQLMAQLECPQGV
ncbi:hypothetical protein P5673_008406 [Acropora cervicornis]|uniref:Uncharacterized protein n=1 Tax=Acropora cervicornis TaxID=6130 RepID=A0AAD9QU74_ACRCE|nr:hypothetical protein P5673_008406 [Acropora cervicornis]